MANELLTEKYADQLDGVLGCYDRLILTGSLYPFCYAQGMSGYLRRRAFASLTMLALCKVCGNRFAGTAEPPDNSKTGKLYAIEEFHKLGRDWCIEISMGHV